MIGLAWFAIVITYVVLSYKAIVGFSKLAKTRFGSFAIGLSILIIALAFPVGDPIYSYYIYKSYCDKHAGPKIFSRAYNVDRVAVDVSAQNFHIPVSGDRNRSRSLLASLGKYKNVENIVGNRVFQYDPPYEMLANEIELSKSLSRYSISLATVDNNRRYIAEEFQIKNRDGQVLATFQYVGWHGGGFTGPIFNFETSGYGPAKANRPPNEDVVTFIYNVLVPREGH